jgi:phytoene synthase
MAPSVQRSVFKAGSRTYFTSSLVFPKPVLREVEILYGFVRVADDYVDAVPQDAAGFKAFAAAYRAALAGTPARDPVIDEYVDLGRRRGFDPAWTEAFLGAMEADLRHRFYQNEAELLGYIYGSAEVVGLFMARILGLPPEADASARLLGRAMQLINFIRDIDEDARFGRRYLPVAGSGYPSDWIPSREDAERDPAAWAAFVRHWLARYREWQAEATRGYRFLPHRARAAIMTAGHMYDWTGTVIEHDPLVVFSGAVKPGRSRIILQALRNLLFPGLGMRS